METSPPLKEEQGPGGRSVAHLAPEEAEQVGLHAEFDARFEVQPLLFALKLVDLDHDSLDLVLVALLIEVDFVDRRLLLVT